MNRREFGKTIGLGALGATFPQQSKAQTEIRKARMHVGCQYFGVSVKELQFLKRHGVSHMDVPNFDFNEPALLRAREQCEKQGISMEMAHVDIGNNTIRGKSPERDKEIDILCERIRVASKVGLRGLNYSFLVRPILRTESTPGRGGVMYSTWVLEKAKDTSMMEEKPVSREEVFDRITYFLERVIPVATEYKVQMACHPCDPPAPSGFRGVNEWNYSAEGWKRFAEIVDSPYHGFNFCCGTLAEGLRNPGQEIYDIVRYFGERKKIFNVHFPNIRGGYNNFQEVYADEGDIDMYKLAKVLKEVDYPYMLMPDHAPSHPDEPENTRVRHAWAFHFGYITALIQAVNAEA